MKILNLCIVIALVIAEFTLFATEAFEVFPKTDSKKLTGEGDTGRSDEGSEKSSDECLQTGAFGWSVQFVDPKTGEKKIVDVIYELDKNIIKPPFKIVCSHNLTGVDDDGKRKDQCPSSGTFVYDSNFVDPKTNKKAIATVGFEVRNDGTVNPKVNLTCADLHSKRECPSSGTFSNSVYRVDSKTKVNTLVRASYDFHDGVYDNKVQIAC